MGVDIERDNKSFLEGLLIAHQWHEEKWKTGYDPYASDEDEKDPVDFDNINEALLYLLQKDEFKNKLAKDSELIKRLKTELFIDVEADLNKFINEYTKDIIKNIKFKNPYISLAGIFIPTMTIGSCIRGKTLKLVFSGTEYSLDEPEDEDLDFEDFYDHYTLCKTDNYIQELLDLQIESAKRVSNNAIEYQDTINKIIGKSKPKTSKRKGR